jgi:TM2 domain-containing membrane protein YozV
LTTKYTIGIVLSAIVPGLGQMYLRRVERGILVLVLGFSLIATTLYFLGWLAMIVVGIIYWVWNVHDARQLGKKLLLAESPALRTECYECHGSGTIRTPATVTPAYSPLFAARCPTCNGIGYVPDDSTTV